jgi:outer membrane immunogenic protein
MIMKNKVGGTVLAAFLAASTAAHAGPGMTTANWSGVYVGGGIGAMMARDHIYDEELGTGRNDYIDHFKLRGGVVSVYSGYNIQNGPWVYGAETDLQLPGAKGDNAAWPFGTDMTARIKTVGSVRGRVGYAAGSNLFYGTLGVAFGKIETHYYDNATTGGGDLGGETATPALVPLGKVEDIGKHVRAGLTLGVGIEHAFNEHWSARAEYRFTKFGRVTDVTTNTDPGWKEHNNFLAQTLMIGATYKF